MPKRIAIVRAAIPFAALFAATVLYAQHPDAPKVDHYTPGALLEQAVSLKARAAAANGAAAVYLEKYGVDYTMLSVRTADGVAELHEKFADIFVILDGSATLISGGEIQAPQTSAPGEQHGVSILHPAATIHLAKGDVIHIPPDTPHQMLIPKGDTITYFVVKVREKD